jgi:hypothetical protein
MKALLVPESNGSVSIELIAESTEESEALTKCWIAQEFSNVSCEEWRELTPDEGGG